MPGQGTEAAGSEGATTEEASAVISSSVEARLSELGRPSPSVSRVEPQGGYVAALGFTDEDIPALIELSQRWADDAHFSRTTGTDAMWTPLHAWRVLAELRSKAAAPVLLAMMDALDETGDDWYLEDIPVLLAKIGDPTLQHLTDYVRSDSHREYPRVAAASALRELATEIPRLRNHVVEFLASILEGYSHEPVQLNAFLISYLADLGAREHAGLIEETFRAGVVDESVCGGWAEIGFELGLLPAPPRRPGLFERILGSPTEPHLESARAAFRTSSSKPRSKTRKARRKHQRRARSKKRRRR
jgi:hypothetical protein